MVRGVFISVVGSKLSHFLSYNMSTYLCTKYTILFTKIFMEITENIIYKIRFYSVSFWMFFKKNLINIISGQ